MLKVSVGQHAERGRPPVQQDFHGLCIPSGPALLHKGIALALADGIGSSDVSHIASQFAVTGFLDDYYCTSEAWSVKTAGERVIAATNAWLHAQTLQGLGRHDRDRGHVCTFSALVLKSTTAHLFHIGDTRIWQLQGASLEPLTQDHRVQVGAQQHYLARAMGTGNTVEVDYRQLPLAVGDVFLLSTDGVHDVLDAATIAALLRVHAHDLDAAARHIVEAALAAGGDDNATLQIVRIEALPPPQADELAVRLADLPVPPLLQPRQVFDGWRIVRELHHSSRSHLYLAEDITSGAAAVLKTPSVDLQADAAALDRFRLEEWVARRLDSPHVLKAARVAADRPRQFLYTVTTPLDGQTLRQWSVDHPRPDIATVRAVVAQVAKGLRAFHRQEMLHQDLRPDNVMIDRSGTVTLIDFGAVRVAGLVDAAVDAGPSQRLGTAQYSAPETFFGEPVTERADLFSLGVLTYHLLTGRLPYGIEVAQCRARAEAMKRLHYTPARDWRPDLPAWVDEALRRAVHPNPALRQADVAEFVHDLHHPNPALLQRRRAPLVERHPVAFWQALTLVLAVLVVVLAARLVSLH